jgi:hypothetical protein
MRYSTSSKINPHYEQVKVAVYSAELPSPESQAQTLQITLAFLLITLSGMVAYLVQ